MADINEWSTKRQNWPGVFDLPVPCPPGCFVNSLLTNGSTVEILSVAGDDWEYTVPDDKVTFLAESDILIVDGGIVPTKFGGITALTNGLKVRAYDSDGTTLLKDWTADFTIKKNADFELLAGGETETDAAAGDDVVEVKWRFVDVGALILLDEGQIFRLTTADDLSGLTSFRWEVQGLTFDKGVFTDKVPRLNLGSFT